MWGRANPLARGHLGHPVCLNLLLFSCICACLDSLVNSTQFNVQSGTVATEYWNFRYHHPFWVSSKQVAAALVIQAHDQPIHWIGLNSLRFDRSINYQKWSDMIRHLDGNLMRKAKCVNSSLGALLHRKHEIVATSLGTNQLDDFGSEQLGD